MLGVTVGTGCTIKAFGLLLCFLLCLVHRRIFERFTFHPACKAFGPRNQGRVIQRTEKKIFNCPVQHGARKELKMFRPVVKTMRLRTRKHANIWSVTKCDKKIAYVVHDHETNFDWKPYLKRDRSQNCTVQLKKSTRGKNFIFNFSCSSKNLPTDPKSKAKILHISETPWPNLRSPWPPFF